MALTTQKRPTQSDTDKAKDEIKRLRASSALYQQYAPGWNFFLDAYEGGKEFAQNKENLDRHFREVDKDYEDRLKRSHYMNYCESLVDFFTDFIFADSIDRHGGKNSTFYNDFKLDVNRKGENIDAFMRQVSDDMQIFGMSYVMVDTPPVAERMTKAQQAQQNIRPYWILIRPLEVLDWVADSFDNLLYFKRKQIIEVMTGFGKRTVERYSEWTPASVKVTDIDITEGENKPVLMTPVITRNALGQVPIEIFRYKRSKKDRFMGKSFLNDIAYNNREVMNLTSLLQEFLYRQCFNMLAMEAESEDATQEEQQGSNFGASNVLMVPRGAQHMPAYVSPPIDPAKFIQSERLTVIQEMYKRSHQDMVNELSNGNKASGFSKHLSFSTAVPKIASRADVLEKGETRLMQLTMMYMRQKWDGKIKYKDRYEITNLTDALAQLQQMFKDLQLQSETFVKSQLKRMVHEYDGKIPSEDMAKIEGEIDHIDMKEFFATQKLAYIGKAAMSPEAGLAMEGKASATLNQSQNSTTRKPSTSAEVASESSKTPKPGGRTAKKGT